MSMQTVWPQRVLLAMIFIGWGINLSEFGKAKEKRVGFIDLFSPLIALTLLYYGGFFAVLGFAP